MRADNRGEGGILALLSLMPEKYRQPKLEIKKLYSSWFWLALHCYLVMAY
jgi:K+ transporter